MVVAMAALTLACGGKIVVDGFTVRESRWVRAQEDVARRATFDLECPAEQLDMTLLNTQRWPYKGAYPSQVGVRGCGHTATYVGGRGTWVMNNDMAPR